MYMEGFHLHLNIPHHGIQTMYGHQYIVSLWMHLMISQITIILRTESLLSITVDRTCIQWHILIFHF